MKMTERTPKVSLYRNEKCNDIGAELPGTVIERGPKSYLRMNERMKNVTIEKVDTQDDWTGIKISCGNKKRSDRENLVAVHPSCNKRRAPWTKKQLIYR